MLTYMAVQLIVMMGHGLTNEVHHTRSEVHHTRTDAITHFTVQDILAVTH